VLGGKPVDDASNTQYDALVPGGKPVDDVSNTQYDALVRGGKPVDDVNNTQYDALMRGGKPVDDVSNTQVSDRAQAIVPTMHYSGPAGSGTDPVYVEGAYGFIDNAAAVGGPESAVGGPESAVGGLESGAGSQIYAGSTGATAWAVEQAADIVYADATVGAAGIVNVDTADPAKSAFHAAAHAAAAALVVEVGRDYRSAEEVAGKSGNRGHRLDSAHVYGRPANPQGGGADGHVHGRLANHRVQRQGDGSANHMVPVGQNSGIASEPTYVAAPATTAAAPTGAAAEAVDAMDFSEGELFAFCAALQSTPPQKPTSRSAIPANLAQRSGAHRGIVDDGVHEEATHELLESLDSTHSMLPASAHVASAESPVYEIPDERRNPKKNKKKKAKDKNPRKEKQAKKGKGIPQAESGALYALLPADAANFAPPVEPKIYTMPDAGKKKKGDKKKNRKAKKAANEPNDFMVNGFYPPHSDFGGDIKDWC
jgi:hypothetical protein